MNPNLSVLVNELKNRARIYVHVYRELSKELGQEKAITLLKRALYARGREKGGQLAAKTREPNLHALAAAFVEGKGELDAFGHEGVLLRLNSCPLVEAWEEAGLSAAEKRTMCDIAYQVDFGKFEAAGYKLAFHCRIADGCESCDLRVTLWPVEKHS
jgi:hypothetical protein